MSRTPIELRPCGPEDPSALRAFAEDLAAAATQARSRAGSSTVTLSVTGVTISLRFAGEALRPIVLPALGHHARDAGPTAANLVVDLWDSAETATPRPALAATGGDGVPAPRGVLAEYRSDTDTVFVLDTTADRGYVCVADTSTLPTYERSSPLLPLLHWALARHGVQVVHGGAVAVDGSAVLVVGPGGSGKSTTCLSVVGSRVVYLADDYCALVPTSRGPAVAGLSAIAKIGWDGVDRLGPVGHRAIERADAGAEKALIDLSDIARVSHRRPVPLAAIVVPDISGVDTRRQPELERIPPGTALRALAPTTLAQLPGAGPHTMRVIAQALRSIPAFRLRPSQNVGDIPRALEELVQAAGGS